MLSEAAVKGEGKGIAAVRDEGRADSSMQSPARPPPRTHHVKSTVATVIAADESLAWSGSRPTTPRFGSVVSDLKVKGRNKPTPPTPGTGAPELFAGYWLATAGRAC